jgi:hypothetical protein
MARIGIEWVKKYHGRASNLSNTQKQAEGFYNKLSGTRSFNWGDDLAWDQDFEEQGVGSPATGTDTTWIDSVHIAFFSGHGVPTGHLFGVAGHDDGRAHHTEIKWGNKVLNWIAFDACQLLRENGVFDRWRDAFDGLHIILGFHTTCSDERKRGRYFAEYLNDGYTVLNAWKKACKETEGSGTKWAYLRAGGGSGVNTYNDHWHGKGWVSPDPTNTWRAYSRGSC